MFSLFIITNTMLDFLVLLLDIPSLLADFSPRAKHKGESLYWRFMGIFLLSAELVILFLWDITESTPALVACIILGLWLIAHLSIRAFRNRKNVNGLSVRTAPPFSPQAPQRNGAPTSYSPEREYLYNIFIFNLFKDTPWFLSYKFLLFEQTLLSGTLTCISNKPGGGR